MKKQFLIALGIAILGATSYATTFMKVKTKDGETVKFDVNDVNEVVFEEKSAPADTTPVSDHEYVDLGLPSGTLWATYNIGATKPEEFGDYFAWGETEPKEVYDWSTYKYAKAVWMQDTEYWRLDSLTKYNSGNYGYPGVIDSLTTLLPEDDVATANWGSDWRMPTMEEQRELIDNCEYIWTEVDGVIGAKFTASNGNSIFLPAAGVRIGSDVRDVGDYGYCWSSSLFGKVEYNARDLGFYEGEAGWNFSGRGYGFPVRAVRAKKSDNIVLPADTTTKDTSDVVLPSDTTEIINPIDTIAKDTSVAVLPSDTTNIDTTSSNHSYVDLGLPSGTLWATYNIGATKPEEYGDYFAWGETSPKEVYDWSTYRYAKAKWIESGEYWKLDSLTKYNSGNRYPGVIDSLTTLLAEDDAATVGWGKDWRMPTNEELKELIENCKYEWTEVGGVSGAKFTASNGNSIFLPAAGLRDGSDVDRVGDNGFYWSSSLYEIFENDTRCLYFLENEAYRSNKFDRFYGFPVRAVRAAK